MKKGIDLIEAPVHPPLWGANQKKLESVPFPPPKLGLDRQVLKVLTLGRCQYPRSKPKPRKPASIYLHQVKMLNQPTQVFLD